MQKNRHLAAVLTCSLLMIAVLLASVASVLAQSGAAAAKTGEAPRVAPNPELASKAINDKVEALLAKMTLEEKIGQMVLYPTGSAGEVGPRTSHENFETMLAAGQIGGLIMADRKRAIAFQHIAVEKSRLHIPIIIGLDVIHGYHTVFPIPLGLAASFDPEMVTQLSHMAAQEARADGIRVTNSPMVDIALDARWGRIAEGSGESPYLGSAMAQAYVHGYQGKTLSDPTSIAACVKHFAAYGAAIAGRDYNAVDMSDITLRQVYLPPYKAAIDAGAATVMSAFNSLNSVPQTADPYTLKQILRKEWGFAGLVRADSGAVGKLIAHGIALDNPSAAKMAALAGLDQDQASGIYHMNLLEQVRSGAVPESVINEAARHVLRVKFALGLFDHPYPSDDTSSDQVTEEKRVLARKAAEESFVLLQNQSQVNQPALLPISPKVKTIALIGPLANDKFQMLGVWHARGNEADVVTLKTALEQRMQKTGGKLIYAEGTGLMTASEKGFAEALQAAKDADLTVMTLGEDIALGGEAASRANIDLPGNQEKLLEEVVAVGKPVVLIVFSGRPLVLNWAATRIPAIVEAWQPGVEAGPALTNILYGDANPSGKLPVSFPRAVGQEPLYLSQFSTGSPLVGLDQPTSGRGKHFVSHYLDVPNSPLYPFGHGLSYTKFDYSAVNINTQSVPVAKLMSKPGAGMAHSPVEASVTVRNTGAVAGAEIVQLYLQIRGTSVVQPVRVLEGFRRVTLAPGESKTVQFPLGFDELSIINTRSQRVVEPAEYTIFIGGDSTATQSAMFKVVK